MATSLPALSTSDSPSAATSATSPPPPPSSSSNPFTLLSNLDPSKKYTLVFLLSVGTTLLVTGFSGGKLLKKARDVTAVTPVVEPSVRATLLGKGKGKGKKLGAFEENGTTSASIPLLRPNPSPLPLRFTSPAAPSPIPSDRPSKSLLRTWTHPPSSTSSSTLLGSSSSAPSSFFLPNATLLSESNLFATQLDIEDRLHKDGPNEPDIMDEKDYVDDGFNPAFFAAKAFGIASLITVSVFSAAVGGVMWWLGAEDLEQLSLALSHSLPPVLASHRPAIPSWALPSDKAILPAGEEEDNTEHKEGVAYWMEVKETLDREAEELKRERRRAWEKFKGIPEGSN